ncbi:hypothetical protein BGZ63DRAFT_427668 [Mariannaea sp. PMI_226]|nr:hypothetical protein BGZ63DRAFT_427668 [Mariannaea sp. PMI_226]
MINTMTQSTERQQRRSNWIPARAHIYYRPRLQKKKSSASLSTARFPSPPIGPRRSRPQAIHIVSYPSGYIPRDLRPDHEQPISPPPSPEAAPSLEPRQRRHPEERRAARPHSRRRAELSRASRESAIGKILGAFSIADAASTSTSPATSGSTSASASTFPSTSQSSSSAAASSSASTASTALISSLAHFPSGTTPHASSSVSGFGRETWAPATTAGATGESATGAPPAYDDIRPESPAHDLTLTTTYTNHTSNSSVDSNMTARLVNPAPVAGFPHSSPHLLIGRSKPSVTSFVAEVPKPVASGSGVSCSIILAEQNIFLSGFEHDHNRRRQGNSGGTALLRGKLQLRITKNVKIKAVQLKLLGRARTEWPEGIPPLKQDEYQEESLRTQVLTFFNVMNNGWETEYGNQCTYRLKGACQNGNSNPNPNSSSTSLATRSNHANSISSYRSNLSSREIKRLSLQNVQSRSFQKDDSPVVSTAQAKGYKVFYPGVYDYSFELPIDHHQLETTKLPFGSVHWELQATVDRAGAFKPNLHGAKELSIIRVPDQLSLEMSEPISISRQWEDQLFYDIVISGKSFPIGSKIPIAFKLTPLAKVQVHKLKVFVTETIEYWTNDKRVTRKEPGRKILLLEKSAGRPLDQRWETSDLRFTRGGEVTPEERGRARQAAAQRRAADAARRQTLAEPLPAPSENLLGELDLGLESFWGATEIEANVQIPTCEMMAKNKDLRLHPDCSWKNVNVYHWIKVVMRISRLDPEDPTGTKRRHFEISIDSPFTVLNCRATYANTNLPAYSGCDYRSTTYQSSCGCPDAVTVPTDISPSSSTGSLSGLNQAAETLPAPPQAAHIHGQQDPRPIHLLRVPSFNPPAFEDDVAPPAAIDTNLDSLDSGLMTPPPRYDVVVGTPSVDGLADYFARLADYDGPDSDSSESDATPPRILDRTGRVNVAHPNTPGGRMPSRSMEISRPPINLDMEALARRSRAV